MPFNGAHSFAIVDADPASTAKATSQVVTSSMMRAKAVITSSSHVLAEHVIDRGIRVNVVAPGPVCTPLQPGGGQQQAKIQKFGAEVAMNPAGAAGCAVAGLWRARVAGVEPRQRGNADRNDHCGITCARLARTSGEGS
jgi:NAD(P)-dependent dehydrogenase (short-subunit alcohol dehydrogenase family)